MRLHLKNRWRQRTGGASKIVIDHYISFSKADIIFIFTVPKFDITQSEAVQTALIFLDISH